MRCLSILALVCASALAQEAGLDSGGPLSTAQAAYDVRHYALDLRIFPDSQRIGGSLTVTADLVAAVDHLELDLHGAMKVGSTVELSPEGPERNAGEVASLTFEQAEGKLRVRFGRERKKGETVRVRIFYSGSPRVAPQPPWDGGFTWSRTADGSPWIGTSCQTNGADLWWPCKDHPSDEPDSFSITVTVPEPLVVASNGVLAGVEQLTEGLRRYRWEVSTPINTYCVALAIAPYVRIEREMKSVAGETFPVWFYALPENVKKAESFVDEVVLRDLKWFEKTFGPYPFRGDKYGVAETPFLGMEHQTIIAYGNGYKVQDGYDWLHQHELAHEWWGNLVSVADWRDFWIHEGIGTWCQALMLEDIRGKAAYHAEMNKNRRYLRNGHPIAPRELRAARQVYMKEAGNDIYYKGAWVMHTLRWLVGDAAVRKGLQTFLYPTEVAWKATDGSQCRSVDTAELIAIMERVAEVELDWFFEVYLRQGRLPRLETAREGQTMTLRWTTPEDLPFPMPVPVRVGDELVRVAMTDGVGTLEVPEGAEVKVDPDRWLLRVIGRNR